MSAPLLFSINLLSLFMIIKCLNLCGDWTQYKDNKCFKVIEIKVIEEHAIDKCFEADKGSSLITIYDQGEQEFLNHLLVRFSSFATNAWIGMKYDRNEYDWVDGTDSNFSNWSEYAVRDGSEPCVQMSLVSGMLGKWIDQSCDRTALVVCQKKQEVSVRLFKDVIGNLSDSFKDNFEALIQRNKDVMIGINNQNSDLKEQNEALVKDNSDIKIETMKQNEEMKQEYKELNNELRQVFENKNEYFKLELVKHKNDSKNQHVEITEELRNEFYEINSEIVANFEKENNDLKNQSKDFLKQINDMKGQFLSKSQEMKEDYLRLIKESETKNQKLRDEMKAYYKPFILSLIKKNNDLQDDFKNMVKQFNNEINSLKDNYNKITETSAQKFTDLQDKINLVKDSYVPLGFLYTQLPNQSPPQQLWPNMRWTEVTQQYAGLFFRVEGGGSERFGRTQQANQSYISNIKIQSLHYNSDDIQLFDSAFTLDKDGGSWTALKPNYVIDHMWLYMTESEVRPKNTAIKIWKRTR